MMTRLDWYASEFPRLRDWLSTAQPIQVPFRVVPVEMRGDRAALTDVPRQLIPRTADGGVAGAFALPPFERIVLFSDMPDDGIALVWHEHAATALTLPAGEFAAAERVVYVVLIYALDGGLQVFVTGCLVGGETVRSMGPWGALDTHAATLGLDGGKPGRGDRALSAAELRETLRLARVLNHRTALDILGRPKVDPPEYKDSDVDLEVMMIGGIARGAMHLLTATFALMNCRNIARVPGVIPPPTRAARRRGDPAPYQFVILKLDRYTGRVARPSETDTPDQYVAVHWVRGHFKRYEADRPLFGRIIGLFWWQPHLAGRESGRFADKIYAVE